MVADCPFTVVVKVTVAVVMVAEEVAVNISGSAAPGVTDNVDGETVTPVGRPETEMVAVPAPAGAASSREAGCPVVPAVRLIVEGVRVSVARDSLLPLPVLLLQDVRPTASKTAGKERKNALGDSVGAMHRLGHGCSGGWAGLPGRPLLSSVHREAHYKPRKLGEHSSTIPPKVLGHNHTLGTRSVAGTKHHACRTMDSVGCGLDARFH